MKKPDPEDPSKKIFDYVEPAGKSLLSNAGKFLEMLQEFDKDNIPDKVRFLRSCGAFTLLLGLVSCCGWFLCRI